MVKKGKVIIAICLSIVILVISYVNIGKIIIHDGMEKYLENKGYNEADIKSIEVYHSFMNTILSYDEWVIRVVYNDEPKAIYFYKYKDRFIKPAGISGIAKDSIYKHGDPSPVAK